MIVIRGRKARVNAAVVLVVVLPIKSLHTSLLNVNISMHCTLGVPHSDDPKGSHPKDRYSMVGHLIY